MVFNIITCTKARLILSRGLLFSSVKVETEKEEEEETDNLT